MLQKFLNRLVGKDSPTKKGVLMLEVKGFEFDKKVLQSEKPVVVDFYADWCGPCRVIKPILEKLSAERDDILFVKVNVDGSHDIAGKYGVTGIPNVLLFKNGEVAGQVVGAAPKATFEKLIDS
jgi:thioredoxin 1